jgi:hypothetical protein
MRISAAGSTNALRLSFWILDFGFWIVALIGLFLHDREFRNHVGWRLCPARSAIVCSKI